MQQEIIGLQSIQVADSSNTTVSLLPAVSGVNYTIYGYDISILTADTIKLEANGNVQAAYYLGADSGISRLLWPAYFRSGAGNAVTLVKGSGSTNTQKLCTIPRVTHNGDCGWNVWAV